MANSDTKLLDYGLPFSELSSIQVEVSSICNLGCKQCFKNLDNHQSGLFPLDLWEKHIIPILPQLKNIYLVGIGEPVLSKHFIGYIKDSKKYGAIVHSTSNLQLIDQKMAEQLVCNGLDNLSFSCDGATDEIYEKIRINGSFEKLKTSLNLINRAKEKYNSTLPELTLNFVASKINIRELPDIVLFAKSYKIKTVVAVHNIIYFKELIEESLYFDQKLSDECFLNAKRIAEQSGILFLMPGLFSKPIELVDNKVYCHYPWGHLYIYSDGKVGPCCMDFPDRCILGNLHQSGIEEIWNDNPFRQLRKLIATNPSINCRFCASHEKMNIQDPRYLIKFDISEKYL